MPTTAAHTVTHPTWLHCASFCNKQTGRRFQLPEPVCRNMVTPEGGHTCREDADRHHKGESLRRNEAALSDLLHCVQSRKYCGPTRMTQREEYSSTTNQPMQSGMTCACKSITHHHSPYGPCSTRAQSGFPADNGQPFIK